MFRRPVRTPLVPVLVVLLPILLVLGIYLGGHPQDLPGFVRDGLVGDRQTKVIDQALSIIEHDYYRKVTSDQLVNQGLTGAVASLHDQFSHYYDPQAYNQFSDATAGQYTGVGISVDGTRRGLRVISVLPDSPARRAGLRRGDVVIAADGRSLAGKSSSASAALIQGKPGTAVTLTIDRHGHRLTKHLRRARLDAQLVRSRVLDYHGHKLGYVSLARFASGAHADVRRAISKVRRQGARGIVFDLRENGGGLLDEGVLVASIFVPQGKIVSTAGRARSEHTFNATGDAIPTTIPVVVLVDRNTASAAEIVTAALHDHHRAKVVGTRTFGKGVFQEVEPLANGGALDITVGEFFTPNGHNLGGGGVKEGRGIVPDIKAKNDPKTKRTDEGLRGAERVLAREIG